MTLPNHERCVQVIQALFNEKELTQWEDDFVTSNMGRMEFTDKQKIEVAKLMQKYDC